MGKVSIDENGKVLITLEVKKTIIPVNGKFKVEGRSEKEFNNIFDAALYALELERFKDKTSK